VFLAGSRNSVGISLSYEYNISAEETSISVDAVLGWNF
jgi:hypothetical protein